MRNNFLQRKKDVLSKLDKSSIGKWDEKIVKLCEKINSLENYYTTSSCSGRIVVIKEQDKKAPELFRFVSHEPVYFKGFSDFLSEEKTKLNLKFNQESFILHVACRTFEGAEKFLRKVRKAGIKKFGIIASGKKFIIEITGTEKLEFPLTEKGKILVSNEFLKLVLKKSNENLKKAWDKIEKLRKLI